MSVRRGTWGRMAALSACCCGALVLSAMSRAQSTGEGSPARDGSEAAAASPDGRAAALERVERRLEWVRRMSREYEQAEKRLADAQRRIEGGADPGPILTRLGRIGSPDVHIRVTHRHGQEGGGAEGWRDRDRRLEGDPERFPPATPEQKYRVDQMLDVVIPDLSQRLESICKTQPDRCEREYARLAYRMRDIIQDGVHGQELFDLRLDEMRVSAQVVRAAKHLAALHARLANIESGAAPPARPEDVKRLRERATEAEGRLEALVAEQFDIRMRIRQEEHAKLVRERDRIQSRIDQLDSAIAEDAINRERIVERKADEALEQAQQVREHLEEVRGD